MDDRLCGTSASLKNPVGGAKDSFGVLFRYLFSVSPGLYVPSTKVAALQSKGFAAKQSDGFSFDFT